MALLAARYEPAELNWIGFKFSERFRRDVPPANKAQPRRRCWRLERSYPPPNPALADAAASPYPPAGTLRSAASTRRSTAHTAAPLHYR
jgi:hypothetical protein